YRSQVRQRKDVAAADRPPCDLSGRGRRPAESCLRTAVAQGSTSEQMSDRLPPIALQSQRGTARSIDGLPLAFLLHADVKMISPLGGARNDRRSNFANCTFSSANLRLGGFLSQSRFRAHNCLFRIGCCSCATLKQNLQDSLIDPFGSAIALCSWSQEQRK